MLADDSFRKPEPEPGPGVFFGGVERLEKVGAAVLGDAHAGVGEGDTHAAQRGKSMARLLIEQHRST